MSGVLVIYTGGTVGMVQTPKGLAPVGLDGLRDYAPELGTFDFRVDYVSAFEQPLDSCDIGPEQWAVLATLVYENYAEYEGFVILHGTDTMAYTASALSFMLQGLRKAVVLTGAQLPMGERRTDARENLVTAIEIAAGALAEHPTVPEVCIYFDYVLLRGNRARKVHADRFEAFDSPNYPQLARIGIQLQFDTAATLSPSLTPTPALHTKMATTVGTLRIYPGLHEGAVRAWLGSGLEAVVLETLGAGNAPQYPWLGTALGEAIARGVHLVAITQGASGTVRMGLYATNRALQEAGVMNGRDLTPEAAVTKLQFLIGQGLEGEAFRTAMERPMVGEMRERA